MFNLYYEFFLANLSLRFGNVLIGLHNDFVDLHQQIYFAFGDSQGGGNSFRRLAQTMHFQSFTTYHVICRTAVSSWRYARVNVCLKLIQPLREPGYAASTLRTLVLDAFLAPDYTITHLPQPLADSIEQYGNQN
jgi:hypothetical protein